MEDQGLVVKGITQSEAAKFETLFKLLDADCTGYIDEEELADLMPRMGVFLSEEELHSLFNSVDADGSGGIDFYEFLQLMARHRESNQLSLLQGGRACFSYLKAASKLNHVVRSDDILSGVLDASVLGIILFYIGIITYEDVRQENIGQHMPLKVVAALVMIADVLRALFTSVPTEGTDTLPVDDSAHVRKKYLQSRRFYYDAIAALPIDLVFIFLGDDYYVYAMATQHTRLAKLLVLPSLFQLSPRDIITPSYARFHFTWVPLFRIFFWACITVHMLSMAWILIADEPADESYINAIYFVVYTITTTGYGDVRVVTDGQKVYCVFLFCCASVVTGLVVGKLVQFSQRADLQADESKRMLETLAALNHLTIPNDFKEEVLAFQLHRLKHSNSLFNDAISGLPQVMQDRMALYARMKIVRTVPIFQAAPEICVAKLAQSLVNVFVPPEEYIVIAGEEGEEMFFLFHGMCGVMLPDGKWVATIKRGGVFGEVALLEETRRSASIKSLTYCQLFRLDKAEFEYIISQYPLLLDSIQAGSVALQQRIVGDTVDKAEEDANNLSAIAAVDAAPDDSGVEHVENKSTLMADNQSRRVSMYREREKQCRERDERRHRNSESQLPTLPHVCEISSGNGSKGELSSLEVTDRTFIAESTSIMKSLATTMRHKKAPREEGPSTPLGQPPTQGPKLSLTGEDEKSRSVRIEDNDCDRAQPQPQPQQLHPQAGTSNRRGRERGESMRSKGPNSSQHESSCSCAEEIAQLRALITKDIQGKLDRILRQMENPTPQPLPSPSTVVPRHSPHQKPKSGGFALLSKEGSVNTPLGPTLGPATPPPRSKLKLKLGTDLPKLDDDASAPNSVRSHSSTRDEVPSPTGSYVSRDSLSRSSAGAQPAPVRQSGVGALAGALVRLNQLRTNRVLQKNTSTLYHLSQGQRPPPGAPD